MVLSTQQPEVESVLSAPSSSGLAVDSDMPAHSAYSSTTTATIVSDTYVQSPFLTNDPVIDQSALILIIRNYGGGRGDLFQQTELGTGNDNAWVPRSFSLTKLEI